jgi:aldehyde dehydrogenase (NAD+)
MREYLKFFIDGGWVEPAQLATLDVENPATELVVGRIALGSAADVDRAVKAARAAFAAWSLTTREERLEVLNRIVTEYEKRFGDLMTAVTEEMGAPASLCQDAQVPAGLDHLIDAIRILRDFPFQEIRGQTMIVREPIGVCGFITPWNWPLNQITHKVAPALATGCTMVLKPSEVAPFSGQIFAEVLDAARVPPGVFNLVHGDGPGVGVALACHQDIDMVSFTGSTRAGIEVARNAAATVKRVHQELGGKSPNIILDDDDLPRHVARGVRDVMNNSGQSCNAPTRMLVPTSRMAEVLTVAKQTAELITVGDPTGDAILGPVVSRTQWNKINGLIKTGVEEGATLVTGGPNRPEGLERGYFVKPTVFGNVSNDMTIANEEIFGPVLVVLGYESINQAIEISNDTIYGLAAYVNGADTAQARVVASRLQAGQVSINGASDPAAPFGGYKMSGNGREGGDFAFYEFLETKAVMG